MTRISDEKAGTLALEVYTIKMDIVCLRRLCTTCDVTNIGTISGNFKPYSGVLLSPFYNTNKLLKEKFVSRNFMYK